jgi:uncharacterized coiled-coil protein SlyX
MNIIFKMLKYLKHYSHLITGVIIVALVVILAMQSALQSVKLNNLKSSYKEEVSVLQTELDSLSTKNEELETKASAQEETLAENEKVLLEKDAQIQKLESSVEALEKENAELKKSAAAKPTTSTNTTTQASGKYSQATQVWNGLKALGLNDYVCAGIIGNIMAEVGGQTLDISRWSQYSSTTSGYYGICQWAGGRKQRLLNDFGTTLEAQIKFLGVELFEVIPKGNSFYNMQDEKEAALYFAKYYERCGSGSYSVRQSNATKALKYFTK